MSYKITVTLPKQNATRLEQEQQVETYYVYKPTTKKEAIKLLKSILTMGVSQTFEYRPTDLLNSQTVFYPAHLIKRVSVEPPIDFD